MPQDLEDGDYSLVSVVAKSGIAFMEGSGNLCPTSDNFKWSIKHHTENAYHIMEPSHQVAIGYAPPPKAGAKLIRASPNECKPWAIRAGEGKDIYLISSVDDKGLYWACSEDHGKPLYLDRNHDSDGCQWTLKLVPKPPPRAPTPEAPAQSEKPKRQGVGEAARQLVKEVARNVKEAVSKIWNGCFGFFKSTWKGTANLVKDTWNGARNVVKKTWNGARNVVKKTWNGAVNLVKNTWNGAANVVKHVAAAPYRAAASLGRKMEEVASSTWKAVKSIGKGLGNFFGWRKKKEKYH